MKKFFDFRMVAIITLTLILIVMCYFYFKEDNVVEMGKRGQINMDEIINQQNDTSQQSKEPFTIQTTAEIKSSLTENVELHATYYLEESYVEANQEVKAGENIIKYTNGTYLTAPYDCVINKINIPSIEGKCTNEHYIEISSSSALAVQFRVDESDVDGFKIGQEAKIEISAYDDKIFDGYITNISNTASNGKFTVTVEFENDGDLKIGMTATVTI